MSEQVWDEMADAIDAALQRSGGNYSLGVVAPSIRHKAMRAALQVIVQARAEQYEALSAREFAWQDVDAEFVWRVMAAALLSERTSEDYVKGARISCVVRDPVTLGESVSLRKTVKEVLREAVRPPDPDPVVAALKDLGRSLWRRRRGLQGGGQ